MNPQQIARIVHEANRALQIEQALQSEQDDPIISISPPWDDLDDETCDSAINGVLGVQQGKDPAALHQSWVEFKVRYGWTLGPVKDAAKKEHPSLVPYDQLPEGQKVKDALFCAIVNLLSDKPVERPVISPPPVKVTHDGRPYVMAAGSWSVLGLRQRFGVEHRLPLWLNQKFPGRSEWRELDLHDPDVDVVDGMRFWSVFPTP